MEGIHLCCVNEDHLAGNYIDVELEEYLLELPALQVCSLASLHAGAQQCFFFNELARPHKHIYARHLKTKCNMQDTDSREAGTHQTQPFCTVGFANMCC